jgi:hypothetical protein
MIINDPIKYQGRIRDLVRQGYIVRTRADEGTTEARRNDMNRFHAACSSGAQIISTDYYRASTLFRSDYVIRFAGGEYWRANPMVDDAGAMGKVFAKQ